MKMANLTETITVRVTPDLKDQIYYLAESLHLDASDLTRLSLYKLVEEFPVEMASREKLMREISSLPTCDSVKLTRDGEPSFLSEKMSGKSTKRSIQIEEDGRIFEFGPMDIKIEMETKVKKSKVKKNT